MRRLGAPCLPCSTYHKVDLGLPAILDRSVSNYKVLIFVLLVSTHGKVHRKHSDWKLVPGECFLSFSSWHLRHRKPLVWLHASSSLAESSDPPESWMFEAWKYVIAHLSRTFVPVGSHLQPNIILAVLAKMCAKRKACFACESYGISSMRRQTYTTTFLQKIILLIPLETWVYTSASQVCTGLYCRGPGLHCVNYRRV